MRKLKPYPDNTEVLGAGLKVLQVSFNAATLHNTSYSVICLSCGRKYKITHAGILARLKNKSRVCVACSRKREDVRGKPMELGSRSTDYGISQFNWPVPGGMK